MSALADRAIVRRPAASDDAPDPASTAGAASLASTAVHAVFVLETAALAIDVDVLCISKRRTAHLDRRHEDVDDRRM